MPGLLPAFADARAQMDAMLTKKAWEDDDFRRRFVADPKGMIAEFLGEALPDSLGVSVHEESPGSLHFVIPAKPSPQALEELSDADLEKIAGGTDPGASAFVSMTAVLLIAASIVVLAAYQLTEQVKKEAHW
jgi:hypothetical protein